MRAVIYTRTRSETGENAQLEQCRAMAAERGWDVVATYSDRDASGSNLDRPALQAAMDLVRSRGCDVLIADDVSRLTRRASDMESILVDADAARVTVHAGSFSSSHAAGRLALRVMLAASR
jgi:site-specific DNA recombinase